MAPRVAESLEQVVRELAELEKAATPGPWGNGEGPCGPWLDYQAHPPENIGHDPTSDYDGCEPVWFGGSVGADDRKLIAVMRNALPALLAAARELTDIRREWGSTIDLLKRERDEARAQHADMKRAAEAWAKNADNERAEAERLRGDLAALRAALEPFADRARSFAENRPNSFNYSNAFDVYVSLGDLRAARAALNAGREGR